MLFVALNILSFPAGNAISVWVPISCLLHVCHWTLHYCLEIKTAFTHPPRGHICSSLQYLSLLQGDLALFLAADERPVTPEDLVTSPQLMSKGCWEESDPVLNYTLKKGGTWEGSNLARLHRSLDKNRPHTFRVNAVVNHVLGSLWCFHIACRCFIRC